jgi:osmotically-inducible protein OsmY
VSLSGTAATQEAADKAVLIAHRTKGVTFVKSTIQVKADK